MFLLTISVLSMGLFEENHTPKLQCVTLHSTSVPLQTISSTVQRLHCRPQNMTRHSLRSFFLSLSLFGTYFLSLRAATATSFYSFEKCPTVTEIEGDGEEKEKPPPKRWGLKKKGWKVHSECDKEGRMQLKITKPCNGSLQLNDERNHGLLHLGCQLCYMQRKM